MLNIVIPMAGAGSRFRTQGYILPKPFIDVCGKMMIERVLDAVQLPNCHYTLIIQKDFEIKNHTQLVNLSNNFNVVYITVNHLTQGACCTALAAHELINNDIPVLFIDSDNIFKRNVIRNFVKDSFQRNLDASLLTFKSQNDCFSYASINENGFVTQTKEKEVISNHAICGAYMFKHGRDFVKYAIEMIIYGDKTKSEYYMSNVYNYLIKDGYNVGIFDIAESDWDCVGTPEQLKNYLNKL